VFQTDDTILILMQLISLLSIGDFVFCFKLSFKLSVLDQYLV